MGDVREKDVDANFTHSSQESFTFSCFNDGSIPYNFDDHELFFDMDVTLPLPWDHVGDTLGSLHSPDSQEFEFRMSFSEAGASIPGAVSPADDLFYKGQLLPLHLPPRLRMVECLSARNASEDEEPDVSSVLLSCYWKSDAVKGPQTSTHDECEAALPGDALSWSSHSKTGTESRSRESRVSSSEGSWTDTDRSLQDPYIFPDCYRDPALQIIDDEGVRGAKFQFSWRKPSLRWKVHMPGSRRSLKVGIEDRNEFSMRPKLRNYHQKEQQKWTVSVFKFRAPASFLKSLFAAGDHQLVAGGGRAVHQKEHQQRYARDHEHPHDHQAAANEEPFRHNSPIRKANCEEGGLSDFNPDPDQQLGISSAEAKAENLKELRLVGKARECLQRYLKLLKPMYVMFSQKIHESENVVSNTRMDVAPGAPPAGAEAVVAPAPSVVSKILRGDHRQELTDPADHHHQNQQQHQHHKQIDRFTLRTTSFSRRSRGNGSSNNHSGLLRVHSDHHQGNCSRSNCVETENPIQGAIAHCKQSAKVD